MLFTSSRQWMLAGVLSHAESCLNTGLPTIATRVTAYMSWLSSMNVTGTVTVSEMTPFTVTNPDKTWNSAQAMGFQSLISLVLASIQPILIVSLLL